PLRLASSKLATHGPHHSPRIIAQHMHAVGEERLHRLGIELTGFAVQTRTRRYPAHPREPQRAEQADQQPTDIELPALHREARRAWERVMVVVQFLAAEQQP